jgi:hypothetical protein
MKHSIPPLVLASGGALLAPATALACPSCPTSRVVARIVCSGDAWAHAAAVAAPFAILGLLVVLLHRIDA